MKPVFQVPRIFLCLALSSFLIIAGLFKSSAKGEYVIHISVINETDEFQNIIVLQQDDELGLMFDKVFPLPWQVFPLPGRTEGIERKGTAEYPFSQQIGVTRDIDDSFALLNKVLSLGRRYGVCTRPGPGIWSSGFPLETGMAGQRNKDIRPPANDRPASPFTGSKGMDHLLKLASVIMGKLTIKAVALNGDNFEYSVDEKGGQHIVKQGNRNKNGSITCRNNSESLVNVDFYKNDTRVAVWPLLANGDEARFLLKRKICFSYDNGVKSGDWIRTRIEGDRAATVELAGYSTIEARLVYNPDLPGKRKKWIIVKN
jgi:hypothetical protein